MPRPDLSHTWLYLCADAREPSGDLEGFVEAALSGGVDAVQLRQKGLEAASELTYLARIATVAARHDTLVAANDRADIARVAHTDLLHLGQDDLPVHAAREIVGPDVAIGLSTHDPAQVDAALANEDVDYFSVGPIWPTPTKPGRPAPGLDLIRYAAATAGEQRPWFAIGGIDLDRIDQALDAGARRVVVVRAITTAPDPHAAAAALASRLRG